MVCVVQSFVKALEYALYIEGGSTGQKKKQTELAVSSRLLREDFQLGLELVHLATRARREVNRHGAVSGWGFPRQFTAAGSNTTIFLFRVVVGSDPLVSVNGQQD